MDGERKRKMGENEEVDGGGGRRKKEREAVAAAPPPTEEEVEEFFAILRRMRVAVNYFQSNGDGRKLTEGWGTAVETTEVLQVVDDVKAEEKTVDGVEAENVVFDLNAVPEAESNSD
ncbi:uncharacterized protein LOC132307797 [Cornus florida]|uniref:uncharacterized protein LOC132307797 n=1 Tax=Cornus florida TaxID=4283 RepID=UPI002899E970|nr:uncharacterized protein LOC132307797 [Cornus florida]